jgi:hypothetical protein
MTVNPWHSVVKGHGKVADTGDLIVNHVHIVICGQGETVLHGKHDDSPESG